MASPDDPHEHYPDLSPVTTEPASPFNEKYSTLNALLKDDEKIQKDKGHVVDDDGGDDSGEEGVARKSEYLYGGKPEWGWDCVVSFKMPKSLREKYGSALSPTSTVAEEDDNSRNDNEDVYEDADDDKLFQGAQEDNRRKSRDLSEDRIEILARLKTAGFVFSQLIVPSENVILVRLSLPEDALKQKAVLLEHELKLKSEFGGGYISFDPEHEQKFINHDLQAARKCYFSVADRSLIIVAVLQSKEYWGCDVDIERMIYEQRAVQVFMLHAVTERDALVKRSVWKRIWDPTWKPPLGDLKDYLGARVTFYFVFVSFYARRLLLISIISIPVYIVFRVLNNFKLISILLWTFSISLVLWTTLFLETWKRRNSNVNIRWGLYDYKEETLDDTRAQFKGELRVGFYCEGGFVALADLVGDEEARELEEEAQRESQMEQGRLDSDANSHRSRFRSIDLPRNLHQDPNIARNARIQSSVVTAFFVCLVGGLTFLLLWFRTDITSFFRRRNYSEGVSEFIPGAINGVMITLFDPIWRSISLILTRRENHRTNQQFENSLIYKLFAFQFVSNYVSLFYIAFVRPNVRRMCSVGFTPVQGSPSCMYELSSQLMSLVVTRATLGQLMELIVPFIISRSKQAHARWKSSRQMETAETPTGTSAASGVENRYVQESKLAPYDSTMDDYNELVIQFGYITLFGLVFPPACVISLLNNWIEVRTDAFKVLKLCQRPSADDAADIGAWYYILEFLNVLSVLTNVGLLVFTADSINILFKLDEMYPSDPWRVDLYRVVAFFIAEHTLLSLKGLLAAAIPDVPSKAHRTIARQQFDIARFFDIGWKNAFRGVSLLQVEEQQIQLCRKYSQLFDTASQDSTDQRGIQRADDGHTSDDRQ